MKTQKYFLFSILFCLSFASTIWSQTAITEKKIYQNIEVEKFTVKKDVEFPAEKLNEMALNLVKSFNDSKKFTNVRLISDNKTAVTTEGSTTSESASRLRISSEIVKYDKGSQAKRYFIGLGAGKTKLFANVKFIDSTTGEVLLEQVVDGIVSWGFLGGDKDQVQSNLSKSIVKIVKEKFTNGKK